MSYDDMTPEYRGRNKIAESKAILKIEEWKQELELHRQMQEQDNYIWDLRQEIDQLNKLNSMLQAVVDEYQENFWKHEVEENISTRSYLDNKKGYNVKIFLDPTWSFYRSFARLFIDKFQIQKFRNEKVSFTLQFWETETTLPEILKYRIIPSKIIKKKNEK